MIKREISAYKDIIDIKHFETSHERMSIYKRAAQFLPFSALTGYEESIAETSRLTQEKIELTDDEIKEISDMLNTLDKESTYEVTYFVPDLKKEGGSYSIYEGKIRRIDDVNKIIYFTDRKKIDINNIINISKKVSN